MHVIMLSWEYPPRVVGGIARHVEDLSKALVKQGVDVDVITCGHSNACEEEDDEGSGCSEFLFTILLLLTFSPGSCR